MKSTSLDSVKYAEKRAESPLKSIHPARQINKQKDIELRDANERKVSQLKQKQVE